jgi:hypothetical protein
MHAGGMASSHLYLVIQAPRGRTYEDKAAEISAAIKRFL